MIQKKKKGVQQHVASTTSKEAPLNSQEKCELIKQGCKDAFKFIAPKIMLIIVVCLYAILGGYLFQTLEVTNEQQSCYASMSQYNILENSTIEQIWTIIANFRMPGDENAAKIAIDNQLEVFLSNLNNINFNNDQNCTTIGLPSVQTYSWTLSGAILFATTIFTTVGYGNIYPKTDWGKIVCITYAFIGIPLMLLLLANIGEIMANIFRYSYLNLCCCSYIGKYNLRKYNHLQDETTNTSTNASECIGNNVENKTSNSNAHTLSDNIPENESITNIHSISNSQSGAMRAWRNQYNKDKDDELAKTEPNVIDEECEQEEDLDDEDLDKITVPIVISLALIASYIFVGAVIFSIWINLTWIDSAYFCFVTISTIGFGDIVPGYSNASSVVTGQLQMLATAVYMVCGMAILSMAFNLMQEEIVNKFLWCEQKLRERKERNSLQVQKVHQS